MRSLFVFAIAFFIMSCSTKDDTVFDFLSCIDVAENFKEYEGEEIGCISHYLLASYNGQYYIEFDNHCADLSRAFVINEDCIDICENDPYIPGSECSKYLSGRELMDIILIEK